MSNHFTDTTDGVRISIYDDGGDHVGPVVSVDHRQPAVHHSGRDQLLDDMQALLDWLRATPAAPVDKWDLRVNHCILKDDDAVGTAVVQRIADAIGIEPDTDWPNPKVYKPFGAVSYEAVYVLRANSKLGGAS